MTTVKQLINKLCQYDENLLVIIEPSMDCDEQDIGDQQACNILTGETEDILLRIDQAQSSRDEGDPLDADYIEYGFNAWEDPVDKRDVLVISSSALKYGEGT